MRIGLTSPFAHPYVRRGSERYLQELAEWLASAGHDVVVLTTAPDRTWSTDGGGFEIRYRRRRQPFGRRRLRVDDLLCTVPPIAAAARQLAVDVIQSHHPVDAAAVRLGTWPGRPPYVLWLPGAPRRASVGGRPLHRTAFGLAVRGAASVLTLSEYAARSLHEEFGVASDVMAPGVRTALYDGPKAAGADVILCTAAAEDPRKRVALLAEAFPIVLRSRPTARLVLAPPRPDAAAALVASLPEEARARSEVRVDLDFAALAAVYREASVAVLPSVREAFGLTVVESLAAGTPVVGTDDGAIPEIIDSDDIGRLFPVDDRDGLARAIIETMELADDDTTADRCRAAARRWDWAVVGPRHERVYADLAG